MTSPSAAHPPAACPVPVTGPALGAVVSDRGVGYCVWAPDHSSLGVQIRRTGGGEARLPLARGANGYFRGRDGAGRAGDRYFYEFADGTRAPDPASRFQPEGVHGPSECIDGRAYAWRQDQPPVPWGNHAIYELHVGAFTPAGTFQAATGRLGHIRDLGATAIELMPVADFPGSRNWGYDGVMPYAPARCYGRPDDLRALVDAAHALGLAVILDVVYNHLGPDGNYLGRFAREYFRPDRPTPWGASFNFDEAGSRPVRDFFVGNAAYWLDEFRCDGLRLDAVNTISDRAQPPILAEIAAAVHARGGFITAEDDRNEPQVVRGPAAGGCGLDAVWADDFHHQVRVALTGERRAYYGSYRGTVPDLARTISQGWFFTGQDFPFWGRPRGAPAPDLPNSAYITCIENHDQIGNRARGERLEHLVTPRQFRAASVLLCLSPHSILLFMGQEWGASSPFLFFTDHAEELGREIFTGRQREHAAGGLPGIQAPPDPQAPETFAASKLVWPEIGDPLHAGILALYREGLRERAAWARGAGERAQWRVRELGGTLVLRCQPKSQPERMLQVAFRAEPPAAPPDDPGLRAPAGRAWRKVLDSNEGTRFGGGDAALSGPLPGEILGPAAVLWEAGPG